MKLTGYYIDSLHFGGKSNRGIHLKITIINPFSIGVLLSITIKSTNFTDEQYQCVLIHHGDFSFHRSITIKYLSCIEIVSEVYYFKRLSSQQPHWNTAKALNVQFAIYKLRAAIFETETLTVVTTLMSTIETRPAERN